MKKKSKDFFNKYLSMIVILGLTLAGTALLSVTKLLSKLDYRCFDTLLGLTKSPDMDNSILLIDIDDASIGKLGEWPWSRDKLADVMVWLKELEARDAVFDIEYLTASKADVRDDLEDVARSTFRQLKDEGEAESVDGGFTSKFIDEFSKSLSQNILKDNDLYFQQALQFFGSSYLTINNGNIGFEGEQYLGEKEYGWLRFTFDNVDDPHGKIKDTGFFTPAISKISSGAKGAGFTNVVVDSDGKRRRNYLVRKFQDRYYGQLAFRPLMDYLDVQSLEVKGRNLVLHGAKYPENDEREDITIPLDKDGCMIVNWNQEPYEEGINHCGVYNFVVLSELESDIVWCMENVISEKLDGDDEDARYYQEVMKELYSYYYYLQDIRTELLMQCQGFDEDGVAIGGGYDEELMAQYQAERVEFIESLVNVLESMIRDGYAGERVVGLAQATNDYLEAYEAMYQRIAGKVCFIGNTATASTDISITPFSENYPQLGMHANVMNTILNQAFIKWMDEWIGILCAFILAAVIMLITRPLNLVPRSLITISYVVITVAVPIVSMLIFKVYIPMVLPVLMVIVIYASDFIFSVKKDRKFITDTFGSYVAPKVVEELIKHPDSARLGGDLKNLTALFSDVKQFSKMSEKIRDPQDLLAVMNDYLGILGDIITDDELKGTLDKFVGDEIVSFFGAPLEYDDENSYHALVAAIRMKQVEVGYNATHKEEFIKKYNYPIVLESRIGINFGPMVVGNIGTAKKLNYSIMGDNVNLASRLEGVNKAYGTWIMASESAWLNADRDQNKGKIVARKLDKVRVVNIERPVQIYNIVGIRAEMPQEQINSVEVFNEAIELYLQKEFQQAGNLFKKAAELYAPDMDVAKVMFDRCVDNIRNGVPEDWDGVYTMTKK